MSWNWKAFVFWNLPSEKSFVKNQFSVCVCPIYDWLLFRLVKAPSAQKEQKHRNRGSCSVFLSAWCSRVRNVWSRWSHFSWCSFSTGWCVVVHQPFVIFVSDWSLIVFFFLKKKNRTKESALLVWSHPSCNKCDRWCKLLQCLIGLKNNFSLLKLFCQYSLFVNFGVVMSYFQNFNNQVGEYKDYMNCSQQKWWPKHHQQGPASSTSNLCNVSLYRSGRS